MKDSGVEWIGEIPESWEIGRMGADCTVKARLGWRGLKASEYVNEGYIFLSTPNIKNNEIDFENVNYITPERYFESPEIMLDVGDVLLAKDGSTLGISNVVRYLPVPATVNSSIAVIKPKKWVKFCIFTLFYFICLHAECYSKKLKMAWGFLIFFKQILENLQFLNPQLKNNI
nr:restriction endonuclease subunit S [Methanobacterium formicicum]